uniref:Uncharacterized protein n=1 Tax=Sphaerodactylus townsendi TaxID=933632 RepID=A0ACB8FLN5_9SAUR
MPTGQGHPLPPPVAPQPPAGSHTPQLPGQEYQCWSPRRAQELSSLRGRTAGDPAEGRGGLLGRVLQQQQQQQLRLQDKLPTPEATSPFTGAPGQGVASAVPTDTPADASGTPRSGETQAAHGHPVRSAQSGEGQGQKRTIANEPPHSRAPAPASSRQGKQEGWLVGQGLNTTWLMGQNVRGETTELLPLQPTPPIRSADGGKRKRSGPGLLAAHGQTADQGPAGSWPRSREQQNGRLFRPVASAQGKLCCPRDPPVLTCSLGFTGTQPQTQPPSPGRRNCCAGRRAAEETQASSR